MIPCTAPVPLDHAKGMQGTKLWVKLPARQEWILCDVVTSPAPNLVTLSYFDRSVLKSHHSMLGPQYGETVTRTYYLFDIQYASPRS
jgi:hypothetical protein